MISQLPVANTLLPVRTSRVLQSSGFRGSRIISPSEIPAGADIIRVQNPPTYVYHNSPSQTVKTTQTVVKQPARMIGAYDRNQSGSCLGCPYWVWLIFGILSLLLIGGLVYGFLNQTKRSNQQIKEDQANPALNDMDENSKQENREDNRVMDHKYSVDHQGLFGLIRRSGRAAYSGARSVGRGAYSGARRIARGTRRVGGRALRGAERFSRRVLY